MKFDDLSNRVIGCAIEVHRNLGPGLLESAYENCLAYELECNKIPYADKFQRTNIKGRHKTLCLIKNFVYFVPFVVKKGYDYDY